MLHTIDIESLLDDSIIEFDYSDDDGKETSI